MCRSKLKNRSFALYSKNSIYLNMFIKQLSVNITIRLYPICSIKNIIKTYTCFYQVAYCFYQLVLCSLPPSFPQLLLVALSELKKPTQLQNVVFKIKLTKLLILIELTLVKLKCRWLGFWHACAEQEKC